MSIIWYTCNLIIINHYNPSLTVTQHLFVRPFGLFLTLFAQLKGRLATKHQCIKACMTERLSGWMNEFSLESVHCLLSITGVIPPPNRFWKIHIWKTTLSSGELVKVTLEHSTAKILLIIFWTLMHGILIHYWQTIKSHWFLNPLRAFNQPCWHASLCRIPAPPLLSTSHGISL